MYLGMYAFWFVSVCFLLETASYSIIVDMVAFHLHVSSKPPNPRFTIDVGTKDLSRLKSKQQSRGNWICSDRRQLVHKHIIG